MTPGTNITKGRSYFSYSEVVATPIIPFFNSSASADDILVINDEILALTKQDFQQFVADMEEVVEKSEEK